MYVSWYTALIAGQLGRGADIGFELKLGCSGLMFPLARLEICVTGVKKEKKGEKETKSSRRGCRQEPAALSFE